MNPVHPAAPPAPPPPPAEPQDVFETDPETLAALAEFDPLADRIAAGEFAAHAGRYIAVAGGVLLGVADSPYDLAHLTGADGRRSVITYVTATDDLED